MSSSLPPSASAPPAPRASSPGPAAPGGVPTPASTSASAILPRLQFAHLRPASESEPALTPPADGAERTQWLDVASAPASARTSFTRVDLTRAGTPSADDEDSAPPSAIDAASRGHAPEATAVEAREVVPTMPQAALTFLLVTGKRRTMAFDPETTVGRVKELVWNTWPSDWQDERPPAPAYLRILYLGKVLQDDETLSKLNIPTHPAPADSTPTPSTIVHLSIRPAHAPPPEADALKKKRSRRRTGAASATAGSIDEDDQVERAGCCASCVIC